MRALRKLDLDDGADFYKAGQGGFNVVNKLFLLFTVVVNKDVALIKQLSLILLADSVPDSARPGPAVSSPGSVPPSAPGDAVSLLRRLAHGALKQRWPDHYGAALA